jgi:DNA-binding GntR family transcriptional regulator
LSRNVASPDWREGTVRGHAEILKIIRSGDERKAAALITEHISFAYERILESYLNSKSEAPGAADTSSPIPAPLATSKRIPL